MNHLTLVRTLTVVLLLWASGCLGEGASVDADCPRPSSLSPVPFDSAGIVVTPMEQFVVLESCQLTPVLVVRLGDADGPGMMEGDFGTVRYDGASGMYFASWSGPAGPIDVFDNAGAYVRSIGGIGEGPGEFPRGIGAGFFVSNGVLAAAVFPVRSWTMFRLDGTFIEQRRVDVPPQTRFVVISPDTVLLTGEGYPGARHSLVEVSSGRPVGELPFEMFGLTPSGEPERIPKRAARGRQPWTVATSESNEFRIREWSLDGTLLGTLRGHPSGLPEIGEPGEREVSLSGFGSVAFDDEGRLWVTSYFPDEEYAAALRESRGRPSGPPVDVPMQVAASWPRMSVPRVDVFDLEAGVHLGSWISPARAVTLLEHDGEVLVYQLESDERGNPFIAVYRLI